MVTKNKEKGVDVMDMRAAVIDSALEQGCPEDKVILVWDAIAYGSTTVSEASR